MRNIVFLLFSFLFSLFSPQFASAEQIADFTVKLEMRTDGSVAVEEDILYDFASAERHGIFRKIPLYYPLPDGKQGRIELANISVTDGKGNTRDVRTEGGGNILELKIGDPDVTVTGKQLYVIRYVAYGAMRSLATVDELYWNTTGNEWPVAITRTRTEVVLPYDLEDGAVKRACYRGAYGATGGCEFDIAPGSATGTVSGVRYLALGLAPGEGVTVAVGVPKGVVDVAAASREVERATPKYSPWKSYLPYLIPIITLLVMLRLWWTRGRDPEGKGVVVAEYAPPEGLTPLEVAALTHETIGNDAISAEIVSLATRGYLAIRKIEKKGLVFTDTDYELTKKHDFAGLSEYDRVLLEGLFEDGQEHILLSQLKEERKMPGVVASAKSKVYDKLVADGYFEKDPQNVRTAYIMTGILFVALGFFVMPALILAGVVVCVFGWFMPRVTERGAALRDTLAGFKRYLSVAEKDRIEFANAPSKSPELFEKFLPFAMVLGVTEIWSGQFADIYTDPKRQPTWYSGGGSFSSAAFARDMTAFSAAAASASAPQGGASGGGGFSGGGGGGGGGGSW